MVLIEMSCEDIKDKELIFSYNLTEGNFLVKKRCFKEAIEAYTRALQLTPGNETCLTQRSKCYLLLGQHEKALKDAEDALADNPTSIKGIIQKAEALYAQGEFEYALVCFHRGKRLRKDIEAFELGIQKASEAVENSIGEKSGLRFCRVGKILKQLEEKQEQEAQAATLRGQKRKQTPSEEYNAKKNYGCKVLLEELSTDKEFLQKLIHHPELTGACKEDIVKEATEVLEFMQTRQEFWGQQKPLYARTIQKKMAEGKTSLEEEDEHLRKRIEDKKSKIQENHEKITKMLMDIDSALQNGSYEQALNMSAHAEEVIMSFTLTWLPRRQAYLGVVYSAMGDAHLKLGHYREALRWHNKDYELSKDNSRLLHSRARALDNLGRTHATFRKYQAAIDAWEQRIPLSKSPEKRTWLFHEIGTCYKELGRYETARFYGTKCVKEARRCDQHQWIMRGLWLLADAEAQLEVMESALKHYDQAIAIANKHGYKHEAKDIEKAYKAASEAMSKSEAEQREKHAAYRPVGVLLDHSTDHRGSMAEGGVRFADEKTLDETEEPIAEEDEETPPSVTIDDKMERSQPSILVTGSDGTSTPDIVDSFDDSGSYIDWTDEDTLPPEEPSQEAIDPNKAEGEDVDDENTDSEGSNTSEDETEAGEEGDMSDDEEGEETETEAESDGAEETDTSEAGEKGEGGVAEAAEDDAVDGETGAAEEGEETTDYETAADETADEEAPTGAEEEADTDAEMATADEGGEATGEAAEAAEGEEGALAAAEEAHVAGGEGEAAEGGDAAAAAEGETPAEDEAAEATAEDGAADKAPEEEDRVEEAPAEEAPVEEAPLEEAPAEEVPAEEAPADAAPAEEAPAEEAPAEEAPAEEDPAEEAPAEEDPVKETPAEETPAEEAPVKEASAEEAPAEEAPAEEAPAEEAPAEEVPAEEAPAEEAPAEEAPAEEAPAEEAPAEEAPAEEGPAEEAPAEEAPAEEAPAEEAPAGDGTEPAPQ